MILKGRSVSAHRAILPARAIELVDAAGLRNAHALLADFAAAGLIKTYALAREITPAASSAQTIRDAQIPAEVWQRIITENKVADALSGGTVRLKGSGLRGGTPAVQITGVSFSEVSLAKILERYCEGSCPPPPPEQNASSGPATASTEIRVRRAEQDIAKKEIPPIMPGALTASVRQTMQVTGLGRTKIDQLMREGTLVRQKVGARSLITVESIELLVGARVS